MNLIEMLIFSIILCVFSSPFIYTMKMVSAKFHVCVTIARLSWGCTELYRNSDQDIMSLFPMLLSSSINK